MVDGILQSLSARLQKVPEERARLWQRDYTSIANYEQSVQSHRESLRRIIGAVDARVTPRAPELIANTQVPAVVAEGAAYKVLAVRWAVFDPVVPVAEGLYAEGLLLRPKGHVAARVVAIPDADWTPEMLAGLAPGVPAPAQFARRLAENGCEVLVPLLINRDDTFSGVAGVKMTNEPHREWVYRLAFEVGRHIIGFEVQKVLAAVDWFARETSAPIGLMGYGEGALIALYGAALDSRITATAVSGYFQERENLWKEPIYRDVWGLLAEFGDAEIASLAAPRSVIVEACKGPEVQGPPPPTRERADSACANGTLGTPPLDSVRREADRARAVFAKLGVEGHFQLVVSGGGLGLPGSDEALHALLRSLGAAGPLQPSGNAPRDLRKNFDPQLRQRSQIDQLMAFGEGLVQRSPERRTEFWAKADRSSPERWRATTQLQRDYIWNEVFGRLPAPSLPPNARTRRVYQTAAFTGYEVVLDVWPDVFAYGILLLPNDLGPGERRPVVICQHGFEGRAQEVADPAMDNTYYHHFAATLAEAGFITYAPQNPYIGGNHFRLIQRMAHPLKLSIYSFILGQQEQTLNWLATQPFVDPARVGFYGISYGGKAALRVPTLLDGYALSICSGDFTEGVSKMTTVSSGDSFMVDDSYDLYEFDFANVVDYAELAELMAPRPFMVERGHSDPTSLDEQVAYEYAKVQRLYEQLGIAARTTIEYFEGGHTIHGVGTLAFLRKHLNFPEPAPLPSGPTHSPGN